MPDAFQSLRAAGFRPRRGGRIVVALRRLLWPLVRPWHFHGLAELDALRAELHALRDRVAVQDSVLAGHRAVADGLRTQLDALGSRIGQDAAALAARLGRIEAMRGALDAEIAARAGLDSRTEAVRDQLTGYAAARAAFEATVHTELLAVGNVVERYRVLVEPLLEKAG